MHSVQVCINMLTIIFFIKLLVYSSVSLMNLLVVVVIHKTSISLSTSYFIASRDLVASYTSDLSF